MFNYHLGKCNKEELEQEILRLKKQVKEYQHDCSVLNKIITQGNLFRDDLEKKIKELDCINNVPQAPKFPNNQITLTKKKNK